MAKANGFYTSDKWLVLRDIVITTYGRKCMRCNVTKGSIHVDHIKPRSLYPELELEFDNMQVLCKRCNLEKSNIDDTDYRNDKLELMLDASPYALIVATPHNRHLTNSLTGKALSLFLWIIHTRNGDNNSYKFDKSRYMKENSIKSRNTFKNAIQELVEKEILFLTDKKLTFKVNKSIVVLNGEGTYNRDSVFSV